MRRAGLALVVAALAGTPAWSRGGYVYGVGARGWILEQFGPDVTILRSRSSVAPTRDAALLLTCAAGDRRLRITLPMPFPDLPQGVRSGRALVRVKPLMDRAASAASGVFVLSDPSTLLLSDRPGGSAVVRSIVGMLQMRPGEIQLVLGFGRASTAVGRLVSYSLVPTFGPGDDALLSHVAIACGSSDNPAPD